MPDPACALHLDEAIRPILLRPEADRIAYIDRDLWIGHRRAREAYERLERILRSERRQRPDNLLVVGPSNNGKTSLAHRFLVRHAMPEDPAAERAHIPVILIRRLNGPRIPPLLSAILRSLGREPRRHLRIDELRDLAHEAMRAVRLRLMLIDDLHFIRGSGVGPILTELCLIGSATGASLGCFATREIAHVLRQDEQLANRLLPPMFLPRWQFEDVEYARLLATFERQLPLWEPSNLVEPGLARRILTMSGGTIGGIAGVLRQAAAEAVAVGYERIDHTVLERVGPAKPDDVDDIERSDGDDLG